MVYLLPGDYGNFGLPAGTTPDWVTGASALINSFCRRPDLNVVEYQERLRLVRGAQTVLLSYLPLAPLGTATSPLVAIEGKFAVPRRGEAGVEPLTDIALAFSLPGAWTSIDLTVVDFAADTGELTLPWNVLGLPYSEVRVTYTAGLAVIGDDVKSACAQIVRNAQAQPALNAKKSRVDTLQMEYFSGSLLDETVKALLRPYVANRLG